MLHVIFYPWLMAYCILKCTDIEKTFQILVKIDLIHFDQVLPFTYIFASTSIDIQLTFQFPSFQTIWTNLLPVPQIFRENGSTARTWFVQYMWLIVWVSNNNLTNFFHSIVVEVCQYSGVNFINILRANCLYKKLFAF